MSKKTPTNGARGSNFVDEIIKITGFLMGISFRGIQQVLSAYPMAWFMVFIWTWVSVLLVYWDYKHLMFANYFFPNLFSPSTIELLIDYMPQAKVVHTLILAIFPMGFFGFIYALIVKDPRKEAVEAINHLGLKTAQDKTPQVHKVIELDEFRKKVLVSSIGIGVDKYLQRKSDLEMSFKATVESIRTTENNKYIEILTTRRVIPRMLPFRNCVSAINEEFIFPIGDSLGGLLTQSLFSLPHMMVAGASGGGKSNFFKQSIVSLMRTTPRLQVYLLDLKKGVESAEFEGLPNVSIAKTETEASILLAKLREEMNERFEILKRAKRTSINPEIDKKDVILIAVDEASVLYSKTRVSKQKARNAAEARELTDDLAKLGRAARMHLIIATQKVTTESIDTKIQENMGGRICFKANTLQGSLTVLGNKMAYELPDIKGRAVWGNGTTFVEVQTPFISDDVLKDEIKSIHQEFIDGKRKSYSQPFSAEAMLESEKPEDTDEE